MSIMTSVSCDYELCPETPSWIPDLRCLDFDHYIGRALNNDVGISSGVPDIYSPWQDEQKVAHLVLLVNWILSKIIFAPAMPKNPYHTS
jgi:hypothetical protein